MSAVRKSATLMLNHASVAPCARRVNAVLGLDHGLPGEAESSVNLNVIR
jgi:hypothetical protein